MNDYLNFVNLLIKYKLINPIYSHVLKLIEEQINNDPNCYDYLILFAIYFSLVNDGNACMPLNPETLKDKWHKKLDVTKIMWEEKEDFNKDEFNSLKMTNVIDKNLKNINEQNLSNVIGKDRTFLIDNGWLYLMKYQLSRLSVIDSIKRLYDQTFTATQNDLKFGGSFRLTDGQNKVINQGLIKNLVITGGPGTGKTTSILFLLLHLLSENKDREVYLTAQSGKAASRMKESIINGLNRIDDEYKSNHEELINKIKNLQEYTIHRLLSVDFDTRSFLYNKNHQFSNNSIFIIDEASMVDICIFDALLSAIPNGARVFIMGDKNQLPSVECGAVFADLLNADMLIKNGNIVALDESVRFDKSTKIFELASAINNNKELPVKENDWKDPSEFEIKEIDNKKPIYYFSNKDKKNEKQNIESVIKKWSESFYNSLQDTATNLDTNITTETLDKLFKQTEEAKILCAENESYRGVDYINSFIIKTCIDVTKKTSVDNYFAGELIIIKKNNKQLELYNGDCGILVTFNDDKTLYFMTKKTTNLVSEDGKKECDKIFKIGSYIFYPFRMLSKDEFDFAYAITIHKSQGSDYNNILVILPTKKGHPLINRQIIYTAITRTKGNTYILSSQEILEAAKSTVITRDTNIKL